MSVLVESSIVNVRPGEPIAVTSFFLSFLSSFRSCSNLEFYSGLGIVLLPWLCPLSSLIEGSGGIAQVYPLPSPEPPPLQPFSTEGPFPSPAHRYWFAFA